MHYETVIYRPPREAYTPMLPVTSGCSHNKCGFCNMYADVPFRIYKEDIVRGYLQQIKAYQGEARRIYLVGGDPFVLSANRLLALIDLIKSYLPKIETVTMYASVLNIMQKSDDELEQLRTAGVNQLYIGLETGCDSLLKKLNKGSTAADAVTQLNRLTAAGMTYGVIIMTGLAGAGKAVANAKATAAVMNQIAARVLYCNSLVVMDNTPLGEALRRGQYKEAGEYERLEELLTLFKELHPRSKLLVNSYHASNTLNINAEVPDQQAETIQYIENILKQTSPAEMDRLFNRKNMRI